MTSKTTSIVWTSPLLLTGCTLTEWKELGQDAGAAAVKVITETPETLTTPTGIIGALIGVISTIATHYLYKKLKKQ